MANEIDQLRVFYKKYHDKPASDSESLINQYQAEQSFRALVASNKVSLTALKFANKKDPTDRVIKEALAFKENRQTFDKLIRADVTVPASLRDYLLLNKKKQQIQVQ